MSKDFFKISRTADETLIKVMRGLGKEFGFLKADVIAFANVNLKVDLIADDPNQDLNELLALEAYLIQTANVKLGGLLVQFYRGGAMEPKSAVYDEIFIHFEEQSPNPSRQQRLAIAAYLGHELKRLEVGRLTPADLAPDIQQILAIHQSNLVRLEELNEALIDRSSQFRDEVERKFQLNEEERKKQLDEQRRKDADVLEQKLGAIAVKEKEVEKRLTEIDDRGNTHARREIRERMLNDVKARIDSFGVSKTTAQKRLPVFGGMLLLMAACLGLILNTVGELKDREGTVSQSVLHTLANYTEPGSPKQSASAPSSPQLPASASKTGLNVLAAIDLATAISQARKDRAGELYWLWVKLTLLSVSLLGTILYYIRWQNKWADQHANAEFQLQQFYIVVNRANWVIESCLEWRKETDSPIPQELIASITNGLFVNPTTEPEKVIHPADELASALMGSASKLKLKLGDHDLEIDKPGKNVPPSKPV